LSLSFGIFIIYRCETWHSKHHSMLPHYGQQLRMLNRCH